MLRGAGIELYGDPVAARNGDRRANQHRNKQTTHGGLTTPETRQSTSKSAKEYGVSMRERYGLEGNVEYCANPSHESLVSRQVCLVPPITGR